MQQGYVVGMFHIGFANEAGIPVRRSPVVRYAKALHSADAHAAAGQVVQRGTAHATGPCDDNIVSFCDH